MSTYHLGDENKLPLVDSLNSSPNMILNEKVSNTALQECWVLSYDPVTVTAQVVPLIGGNPERPLTVRVLSDYVGANGEGFAGALVRGHHVRIQMTGGHMGGMRNTGVVVGAPFLPEGQAGPAYAPFQKTGTGYVFVGGKFKHAEHVDGDGNRASSSYGQHDTENTGGSAVIGGRNAPRAEDQIREAADGLKKAVQVLTRRLQ